MLFYVTVQDAHKNAFKSKKVLLIQQVFFPHLLILA